MLADVVIILALVAAVVIGVFRGALRQLLVFGAWLVAFIVAAQMRPPIADWLIAQEPDFSHDYAEMVALLLNFVVLFGLAVIVIEVGGKTVQLSLRPMVDEVVGGLLMLGVGLLTVATLLIALDSYFAVPRVVPTAELDFIRQVSNELEHSAIATALRDSLVPGIKSLLGPLLPADVRGVV